MYLGILGFLTMILIMIILFKSKIIPTIAFILIPIVMALLAGFSPLEIGEFIKTGILDTAPTAALFIFSITFFGIMSDTGMFDRVINRLVGRAGQNVIAITMLTAIIAMIGHLDGSGASTFLITIPAMLPIYKKYNMRTTTLMLVCTASMGVMNLLPWGGPTMRVASVLGMEANLLWQQIIPMQVIGLITCLVVGFIMGKIEMKRGAGSVNTSEALAKEEAAATEDAKKEDLTRPKLFGFNVILTLAVILTLSFVKVPTYLPFMIGVSIALIVNYPGAKAQQNRIKAHSASTITMAATLLGAGVLLGVLEHSGMMTAMGELIVKVLPPVLGPYIHIIIGVLSAPLALMFCTDSYYFGLFPILMGVGESFGVDPVSIGITMIVCRNCASFISPVVPATFLGCGLAGIDINTHIKASFWWVWGISIIMLISGILLGIVPLF